MIVWIFKETLIYCHPGKNQHGKRKARFPLSFISNVLQTSKMATPPVSRETRIDQRFPTPRIFAASGQDQKALGSDSACRESLLKCPSAVHGDDLAGDVVRIAHEEEQCAGDVGW